MRALRLATACLTVILVGVGASPASAVVAPQTNHPTSTGAQPAAVDTSWLDQLNRYRQGSGLMPVTVTTAGQDGLQKHLHYLINTPPAMQTGSYASPNTENPASPFYTPEGATAASQSLVTSQVSIYQTWPVVDTWFATPSQAAHLLIPQLTQVTFAYEDGIVGLNYTLGLDATIQNPNGPILFPGDGLNAHLWLGASDTTALAACGLSHSGAPLFVLTTVAPTDGMSATLTADDGPDFSTADGSLCLLDGQSKINTSAAAPLVSGGYHQLVLIPNDRLTNTRYHVTINQPSQAPISWSFVAVPQGPTWEGLVSKIQLHVAGPGTGTVLGNLTVTDSGLSGFTTAYSCLDGRPLASNNNYLRQQTIPNFVAVHPDANGDICLYASQYAALIWDQVAETSAFTTHNAVRLLDTRSGAKPSAGSTTKVHVTDAGAPTVLANLTVTEPTGAGFTTVYPCLDGRPTASNNNYVKGQTIPNFVAAHPDSNGDVCIYTSASTQLIWDQVGETDAFASHTAQRLLDTRTGSKPGNGGVVQVHVTDAGAQTVFGNLTVTAPNAAGFTTVYPCLDGRPNASNNNYVKGQTIPNFVAAHPDANGDICIYTNISAHLIWDQVAETSSFTAHNAVRVWDARSPHPYKPS